MLCTVETPMNLFSEFIVELLESSPPPHFCKIKNICFVLCLCWLFLVTVTGTIYTICTIYHRNWGHFNRSQNYASPRLFWRVTNYVEWPSNHLSTLFSHTISHSRSIPSPSSLMDLGSETAKHCMVSYFCCCGSCSSSWLSLWGLTSIRQLNVWLFLLGLSLDHGTPFTAGERGGGGQEGARESYNVGDLDILFDTFLLQPKMNNKTWSSAGHCQERLLHCKWKT